MCLFVFGARTAGHALDKCEYVLSVRCFLTTVYSPIFVTCFGVSPLGSLRWSCVVCTCHALVLLVYVHSSPRAVLLLLLLQPFTSSFSLRSRTCLEWFCFLLLRHCAPLLLLFSGDLAVTTVLCCFAALLLCIAAASSSTYVPGTQYEFSISTTSICTHPSPSLC